MNKCPKCKRKYIVGVEYSYTSPERYDGVSEWLCPKDAGGCGYRQGRWTGQELHDGELESRYGERGVIKSNPNQTGGKRMNSPNTSSEVDKKAFKQLSGVLERMYYDVKKGLSDLRPYERQIKAIFRKRQDYETHQSEIKGRIDALESVQECMFKDQDVYKFTRRKIKDLNQMKGKV